MNASPSCPTRQRLALFLDQALEPAERDQVASHIQRCADCQATLDRLTESDLFAPLATRPAAECPSRPDIARPTEATSASSTSSSSPSDSVLQAIQRKLKASYTLSPSQPAESVRADLANRKPTTEKETNRAEPGEQIGQYAIECVLGTGASGVVYRARDLQLNRQVAIKMLRRRIVDSDDAALRLQREARSVASLSHPNILALYEIGQDDDGQPFLVFEFVDGDSLEAILTQRTILPPREAARLIRDVAQGLEEAHRSGLIHRDIKPSNIIVQRETGEPKIVDFGLAIDDAFESRLTAQGMIAGTPAYMSPEQVRVESEIDARTDLYSLGIVLYECLTGEVPFRGITKSTLDRIVHEQPADPRTLNPSTPRDLATIALKAIAKEPRKRYPTAQAMGEDLDRWLDHRPILARPISRWERGINWARRNPLSAGLGSLVALLALALVVGSLIAASRMAAANRRVTQSLNELEQTSAAVERQRDVLLESMQKLVYRINDSLEKDIVVDLDQIQRELLRVAIEGLENVSRQADDHLSRQSAADAHFRLANVLYRLDEMDLARQHLEWARKTNQRVLADHPQDSDALVLSIRTDWLAALIDFEPGAPDASFDALRAAWKATDQSIDRFGPQSPLLIDAMSALDLMAQTHVERNEWSAAQDHWNAIVHYADRLLQSNSTNRLEMARDHPQVWLMKIDAQNELADLAWQQGEDLEAARLDLTSTFDSIIVDLMLEMELDPLPFDSHQPLEKQAEEYLSEWIDSLNLENDLDDSERMQLAEYWATLREIRLAARDSRGALDAGRQAVQTLTTPDGTIAPEARPEWVKNQLRLSMILTRSGKATEAQAILSATRRRLEEWTGAATADPPEVLSRFLPQLVLLESQAGLEK